MSRRIWTVEKCKSYAAKCTTRTEMLKRYPRAYDAAVTYRWLNSIFSKHTNKGFDQRKKKQGYWTNERLLFAASRCSNRQDFAIRYPGANGVAYQKKIIDQIFADHTNQGYLSARLSRGHWKIKANCEQAALQCKTRSEFIKRFKAAYRSANRNGWYEELCSHMQTQGNRLNRFVYEIIDTKMKEVYIGLTHNLHERMASHRISGRPQIRAMLKRGCEIKVIPLPIPALQAQLEEARLIELWRTKGFIVWNVARAGALGATDRYWTLEGCRKIAKKCKDRDEMRRKYNGAIQTAVKFKWLDKIFKNHPNQGFRHKPHGYWTLNRIKKLAVPYGSRGEFKKAERSAYGIAHQRGWLDQIFKNHTKNGYVSNKKDYWTIETCRLAATKAKTRTVFYQDYSGAAKKATDNGWMEKIFSELPNGGYVNMPRNSWTFKKLLEEVKECKTRAEFKIKNPSAYFSAQRTHQLANLFAKHPNQGLKYKPYGYWTVEHSKVEAKKFKTKMQLKKSAQGAYHSLRKNGLLEVYFPKRSRPAKR